MPLKVFITGASSGIGSALAQHYAALGATLGLAARREGPMRQLAASLSAPTSIYPLDVTDGTALAAAAQDFVLRHGVPDIVIANAGVSAGTQGDLAADLAVLSTTGRGPICVSNAFNRPSSSWLMAPRATEMCAAASMP
jgi:NADP-dependent 3-hydroxy acid dehydrogenase YdfG